MNNENNTIGGFLKAGFDALKGWFIRYSRILLPVILVICVALTIVIAIQANKRKVEQEETVVAQENGETEEPLEEVPLVPLEKDAVPGMNELFETYYKAMVDGDTETMGNLLNYLDATERLRAAETSKYIESASIEVYTKAGPSEGTYIAYIYTELKFFDYDKPLPGLNTFYVCTREDGSFFINEDCELSESERRYIREVQIQDDVIDLNNKVTVAYNDMVVEDSTLADFLGELTAEIEKNVGETLARAESAEQISTDESGAEENAEAETTEGDGDTSAETVVTEVKTTDVVNIRTSDSETADKLGKAAVGDTFKLLEERGNGWSKVEYDGGEAFIKSDYLEPSKTETADAAAEEPAEEDGETASAAVSGTVTVKENVRIRSAASETSEKLATAYAGDKLDLIMKQADGWTKIRYNGKTAYVKSDYVE
ncbi:MAG: SH3 domain-containing protein [Bacteroidales bacterium]|nr:SH3 domain-containing protein [Bacteroidales bacterium]MCM1416320.1 SH3 domain-containing protein [bacterium]MCM1423643.1 SH3 domain-containing protein [bacterium]